MQTLSQDALVCRKINEIPCLFKRSLERFWRPDHLIVEYSPLFLDFEHLLVLQHYHI